MLLTVGQTNPPAGLAVRKGLQRLAGTATGLLAGLGLMYFVYLINGLSYLNRAPKVSGVCQAEACELGCGTPAYKKNRALRSGSGRRWAPLIPDCSARRGSPGVADPVP